MDLLGHTVSMKEKKTTKLFPRVAVPFSFPISSEGELQLFSVSFQHLELSVFIVAI